MAFFDGSLIVNRTFSKTEFVNGKLDFAHVVYFHLTKCLILVKFENNGH